MTLVYRLLLLMVLVASSVEAYGAFASISSDSQIKNYSIRFNNNWLMTAGAVTNTYDDNGNLVDRGGDLFIYDSFNRLVGASVGSNTALYTYNHLDGNPAAAHG